FERLLQIAFERAVQFAFFLQLAGEAGRAVAAGVLRGIARQIGLVDVVVDAALQRDAGLDAARPATRLVTRDLDNAERERDGDAERAKIERIARRRDQFRAERRRRPSFP